MWIVENFSKEATEARNYEEKIITFNIKNIEQKVHILIKTANDKNYTNRNKAKDINKYIKNINDQ